MYITTTGCIISYFGQLLNSTSIFVNMSFKSISNNKKKSCFPLKYSVFSSKMPNNEAQFRWGKTCYFPPIFGMVAQNTLTKTPQNVQYTEQKNLIFTAPYCAIPNIKSIKLNQISKI